jgi:uncharacterized oligopeptide transporter (OPT) family protein
VDRVSVWQSFLICLTGGVLGVLFTIRCGVRLVTNSDLPYPEGVAAAEVLRVDPARVVKRRTKTGERVKVSSR